MTIGYNVGTQEQTDRPALEHWTAHHDRRLIPTMAHATLPAFTDHARITRKDGQLKMAKRYPRVFVPGTSTLLLSDASKMPTLSWSLPAGESCPWALYGEGTICGDCYAMKGRYVMPNVAAAQRTRFEWVRQCLKSDEGTDTLVSTLVDAIRRAGNLYFRVHDSGDLFSPAYVRAWIRVCRALPEVTFWFPTRAWRVLTMRKLSDRTRHEWALALTELAGLPNVTMRPSALFFNAPAPRVPGMAAGTTACAEGFSCPAATQGNVCGSCRACWTATTTEISYHQH